MHHVNEADLEWDETDRGDTHFRRKQLSAEVPADQLGCSIYELSPGAQSWPYHYHTANEEAMYVLAGEGQVRTPAGKRRLTPGEFVTFPPTEDGAHRVVNDGDETLRYLMVSTMTEPDVTIYPEMEKFGVFVGSPPGGEDRTFQGFFDLDADVPYWEE